MAKILKLKLNQHYPIPKGNFIDYEPAENCCNADSYGELCVKCEQCGRKFINGELLIGGAE